MKKRKCSLCAIEKPLTAEFFHRHGPGFTAACKDCRNKSRRANRSRSKKAEVMCSSCLTVFETYAPDADFVCTDCNSACRRKLHGLSFQMTYDPDGMLQAWGMLSAKVTMASVEDGCFTEGTQFEKLMDRNPTGQIFEVRDLRLVEIAVD